MCTQNVPIIFLNTNKILRTIVNKKRFFLYFWKNNTPVHSIGEEQQAYAKFEAV